MSNFTHKIAAAAIAVTALAGSMAATTTAVVTTNAALSIMMTTTAEAKVICRDKPRDTRTDLTSAVFEYQPRVRKGLVRCKNSGPVRKIQMLLPQLPRGAKPSFDLVRRGLSTPKHNGFNKPNGCNDPMGKRGKKLFHAACVAHDICYRTPGAPKRMCEIMFRKNMLTISKHGPVGSRVKALSFVAATATFAHKHYRRGQVAFMQVLASGNY